MLSKGNNIFNYLVYASIYIFVFVLMGFVNLASVNFDLAILMTSAYWLKTVSQSALYIILYTTSMFLSMDVLKRKDQDYVADEKYISSKRPILLTEDFDQRIIEINRKQKRWSWIDHWRNKKARLIDKRRYKVVRETETLEEDEWSRATVRSNRKLSHIENNLTNDFINNELEYVRFKYPRITRQEVISGTERVSTSGSLLDKSYHRRNFGMKFMMATGSIIITAVLNALLIDKGEFGFVFWMAMIVQLVMALFNIFMGMRKGYQTHTDSIVANQNIRLQVITEYEKDLRGGNNEKT